MEGYYGIDNEASWEQVIEKSRFIGVVFPVYHSADIEQAMNQVRLAYPGARHYVYAYRLLEGGQEKYSDDGEPQGTGGRPILDILQHRRIWNVLLVVVRYFGGILLGTGGLTRAYGGTARRLLDEINLIFLSKSSVYSLKVPYPWYERLKYQIQFHSCRVLKEEFSEHIIMEVAIPFAESEEFCRWLEDYSSGQVEYLLSKTSWLAAFPDS